MYIEFTAVGIRFRVKVVAPNWHQSNHAPVLLLALDYQNDPHNNDMRRTNVVAAVKTGVQ